MVKELTLIGLFAALYLLLPLAAFSQEPLQRAAVQGPVSLIPTDANLFTIRREARTAPARLPRAAEPTPLAKPQSHNPETSPFDGSASRRVADGGGYAILGRAATTGRNAGAFGDEPFDNETLDPAAAEEFEVIRNLQTRLNALGYDAGHADGLLGPRTRDAVDAFRTAEGIDPSITEPTVLLVRADAVDETQAAAPVIPLAARDSAVEEAMLPPDAMPPPNDEQLPDDEQLPLPVATDPATVDTNRENSDRKDLVQNDSLDTPISPGDRTLPSAKKRPLNALDLIGRVMTNDRGMKLGEVRNLLFERDGRVAGLLVRVGGFHLLGDTFASIIGEPGRDIAVPWSEVQIDWYGRVLVEMTWTDVENAQTYDPNIATVAVDM